MNKQLDMLDQLVGELQKNVARRSVVFFNTGWVILAGCLSHFMLVYLGQEQWIQINWIVVPILCIILGLVTGLRSPNSSNISHSELFLKSVWGVVGLVMIYLSLIAPRFGFIPWDSGLPLALILLFIPIMITGITIKHLPTMALSSVWFVGSIAASTISAQFHVHILTLVVILGYLLPAYLIKARYN